MFKKIIAFGGAALALLAFAVPSMAQYCWGPTCFSNTNENYAAVTTVTQATANTGGNSQLNVTTVKKASEVIALSGSALGSQTISTGNAYASADSLAIVNASPCGCSTCTGCMTSKTVNGVTVGAQTFSDANAGTNQQANTTEITKAHEVAAGSLNLVGSSNIYTGAATSVVSSRTLVNVRPIVFH